MAQKYNAEDIKILEGLDAVRLRPGMYIGSTGPKGLHHILWEIVDNAIDEAANGYADKIEVRLYKDGSASVEDNGRGIPTDIHPKTKVSGVQVVFTQLHAGGKFDEHNYSFSGGLHGVGASVTNALSEWLTVEVYKKTIYKIRFTSYYNKRKEKYECGIPDAPLEDTGVKTNKKGTFVRFKPDGTVFSETNFDLGTVRNRLQELAFLNRGLQITLVDERITMAEMKKETGDITGEESEADLLDLSMPYTQVFKYEGGISDFALNMNDGKTALYKTPLYYSAMKDGILVEFAVQHTSDYTESMYSFVNNIPTPEGGYHEMGFRSGLTRVLNDYAKNNKLLKDKDPSLQGEDFREGLTAILSIKMKNVQFEGQTKTKLGNPEARVPVESVVVEGLTKLIASTKGKVFEEIIKKAQGAAKVRLAARQAKETARAKNSIDNLTLIGKLAACSGKKPELNELFIVEGDSAGGTAKQARVRQTQSILPLRGKPLNVEKKALDKILQNEEIRTMISAIGAGMGSDFNVEKINYHKVIILSDADPDGYHIRCILLTFFYRYMRDLVNGGYVYIGMPPLYKVYKGNVEEYAYNDAELEEKIKVVGRGYQIQRYKGLGEMSAEQLWDTTMNPATRNLTQVTIESAAEAERMITTLMGDKVDGRKQFLAQYANFNKVDNFMERMNVKKAEDTEDE
ncbi:MAG: DNA gyrase subunit B [Clostridia bacterium]|nr:DNA gyrase subunit B [Clostridia bacterium]